MTSKRQFVNRCEKLGVKYHVDDEKVEIDAPSGFCFGTNFHHFQVRYMDFDCMSKSEIYDFMLDDMSMGIDKCNSDCEYCQDNRGEV